jgi:SAM-dependent methyltransferase
VRLTSAEWGCPGCGSQRGASPLFAKGPWKYGACRECGLVHLDPVPKPDETASLYSESYFSGAGPGEYVDYVADEELHRANARVQLARLAKANKGARGTLLDVGCAYGFVADEARRAGWDVDGVEIATVAAQSARDRFGLVVLPDLKAAVASGKTYDVVAFFQVLAQFGSSDDALEAAHQLIRPGGLLIVETANRGSRIAKLLGRHWHFIAPPTVISLFDPETLDSVLLRTGCQRVANSATRKSVSLELTANALEQRYGKAFAPLRAMTQKPPLRGRAIRYPFADLMTVIAARM